MFSLWVLGKIEVTKSSVMESSQTVVKNSEDAKKEAVTPVSDAENNSDNTKSPGTATNTVQTDTTTPSITQADSATVSSSGVTTIVVAPVSVTQTGVTASGWAQTSINTYRAPNISTKRLKQ